MNPNTIALGLLLASLWAVLCRLNQLHPEHTRLGVAVQYIGLGMGLAGGLLLPAEWARTALAAGTLVFLLAGRQRWRDGAPPDVRLPCHTQQKDPTP